jgi:hypothetical protein
MSIVFSARHLSCLATLKLKLSAVLGLLDPGGQPEAVTAGVDLLRPTGWRVNPARCEPCDG